MNSDKTPKKPGAALRLITASALALSALCAPQAQAQVPGRFYWHTLSDSNAVPLIFQSISGNSNPFDPANTVTPGAKIEATMALTGYARTFIYIFWASTEIYTTPISSPSIPRPASC